MVSSDYDVRSFGARGDGSANDTKAVQAAIDQCSKTGGRVVFPPGEYRTGMIRLKSHVTVDLLNQAVWRAIPDVSLYPKVVDRLPGTFLFAENAEDLHITGQGKIHGSGDAHGAFIPWKEQTKGPRPFGLLLMRCRNLSLTGVTLESSAYWMLRPTDCEDVVIRGIKIVNLVNFNNDGIDVVDCHRVIISDCVLDCEDDAICLKTYSGKGVEDVAITNCVLSSHARVIKISGPPVPGSRFNRIAVSNCVIKPSRAKTTLHPAQLVGGISGIDFATSSQGAALTNVSVTNVVIDGVLTPIFMRLSNQKPPSDVGSGSAGPGRLENITISNIRAVNAGPVGCMISGHPGHYVEDIKLSNVDLAFSASGKEADVSADVPEKAESTPSPRVFGINLPAYGFFLRHVKDLEIDGLRLRPREDEPRPELLADDVHGLDVTHLSSGHPKREKPWVKVSNSTRVRMDDIAGG
ncbi:MAG: glycosyl hydrolase family 28 protein [Acidobacteria bacterium]|nr:glycosyl hydrolase family 28 protein [Acidobacteriota bacterium]